MEKIKKSKIEPIYNVSEFAKASNLLGTNADIVRAAFLASGKYEATEDEARKIVDEFKNREVK